jgi:hypothetical protein
MSRKMKIPGKRINGQDSKKRMVKAFPCASSCVCMAARILLPSALITRIPIASSGVLARISTYRMFRGNGSRIDVKIPNRSTSTTQMLTGSLCEAGLLMRYITEITAKSKIIMGQIQIAGILCISSWMFSGP